MKTDTSIETRTTETDTVSRAEYEKLQKEIEWLTNRNRWLEEQLKVLNKNHFGSKHESASDEVIGQMVLFDEAESYAYLEELKKQKEQVPAYERRAKKDRAFLLDNLPKDADVEVEVHELTEEERHCPVCGAVMEPIGTDIVRTLELIPAKFVVHEDRYVTYACKECANEDAEEDVQKTQVRKTPHIPSVYPGSNCSPSAAAYLMTEKYVMGSPLYRMEADFNRKGYALSRQTMSNWMIHCAETWLGPIYEELHRRLQKEEIIHADETELQVLKEPGRKAKTKSYMWLYRTGKHAEHPIILYEYQPGRKGDYPKKFLEEFSGYLQTDGYCGYNDVANVIHVGCMAHLKRKFHDAVTVLPEGKKTGAAVDGEAYCLKLFQLEDAFKDLTPEERKKQRQELAKPILDEFLAWGSAKNYAGKSKLGTALTYLNNNREELSQYLNDGRLEISNNLAERSIKPFVIDRKNFLFANTPKGAAASAITFSIIQTAIACDLDPYKYLTYVFTEAPKLRVSGEDWIQAMLPENISSKCGAVKERSHV